MVVNDLGGSSGGEGNDATPAQQVVDEIAAKGGKAVANYDSVSSWAGAEAMIQQAVEAFGGLDVLINNAGILRDKMSFNMDEAEWDAVVDVHLKGHFAPSRFAASYWRAKSKETSAPVNAKIVNTASESGLYGNAGQANYAAAKARHRVVDDRDGTRARADRRACERDRAGRAHAPHRTGRGCGRLHESRRKASSTASRPRTSLPSSGWLASDLSEGVTGQVVKVMGGQVQLLRGWRPATQATADKPWTIDMIQAEADALFATADRGVPLFMPNLGDA